MSDTAADILENLKSSIMAAIRYIEDHPEHPFKNLINWIDMLDLDPVTVEVFFDLIIRDFLEPSPDIKIISKLVPISPYQLKLYDMEVYN